MKNRKFAAVMCAVAALFIISLSGCGEKAQSQTMEAVIVENAGNYILIAKTENGADLCTVSLDGVKIVGEDGKDSPVDQLEQMQVVEIEYSGEIAESYPAQMRECFEIRLLGRTDEAAYQIAASALEELNANVDGESKESTAESSQSAQTSSAADGPIASEPQVKDDPIAQEPQIKDDDPIAYEPQLEDDDPIAYKPQLEEDDHIAYEPQLNGESSAAATN